MCVFKLSTYFIFRCCSEYFVDSKLECNFAANRIVISSEAAMGTDESAQWSHSAMGLSDVYDDRQI